MSRFAAVSFGGLARLLVCATAALPLLPAAVLAQGAPAAASAASDPIVAKVDGQPIRLSEVVAIAQSLPEGARAMPPQTLYPMLIEQIIDARALAAEARRKGLDKDPEIQRQVAVAAQRALETALLQKEIGPLVTEAAVRARYDRDIAGKPGIEEVRARHILVDDEATAKTVIVELGKGGDFAALSTKYSKDPGASRQGGDLGFFKRDDMVPEFATAAFALKDGQVTAVPVKTQFGWHVIQLTERRRGAPATFEQARDELRQQIIQDGVRVAVARARGVVSVETFNMDGSVPRATDSAMPPAR
jgi:peptidyl-prolyl cis-trans isomerase C